MYNIIKFTCKASNNNIIVLSPRTVDKTTKIYYDKIISGEIEELGSELETELLNTANNSRDAKRLFDMYSGDEFTVQRNVDFLDEVDDAEHELEKRLSDMKLQAIRIKNQREITLLRGRLYYHANKDKLLFKKRIYRIANSKKIAQQRKETYLKNKDKIAEYYKLYRERKAIEDPQFIERDRIKKMKYYEINKDKILSKMKIYRLNKMNKSINI